MRIKNIKEMSDKLNEIKVSDIMSRFAITTSPETAIMDLAHLLMRFKISGVPVVGQNNEIIGIVTATDLFEIIKNIIGEIENGSEDLSGTTLFVKDVMTTSIFSVSEDATLFDALKLMCEKNVHTLPVISGKDIAGVVGRRDVINAFYAHRN